MMRKELYRAICSRLQEMVPEVVHMDMWNQNVEFAEEESVWGTPAVFVEFGPINWTLFKEGNIYRGVGKVMLHIVTEWSGAEDDSAMLISDKVVAAVAGLRSKNSDPLNLQETYTNHNHESLVESIEVFSLRYLR